VNSSDNPPTHQRGTMREPREGKLMLAAMVPILGRIWVALWW
jgi:hypothetical protein